MMVIGTAGNPHTFKKNKGQELGFDYHKNKNARMTSSLLFG